jgi:hypothetical protein
VEERVLMLELAHSAQLETSTKTAVGLGVTARPYTVHVDEDSKICVVFKSQT